MWEDSIQKGRDGYENGSFAPGDVAVVSGQLPLLGVQIPDGLMRRARGKYREIIGSIQPFGENDALEMNIISGAMLAAAPTATAATGKARENKPARGSKKYPPKRRNSK